MRERHVGSGGARPSGDNNAGCEPVVDQYGHPKGLGRVALGALGIGIMFGVHAVVVVLGMYFHSPIAVRCPVRAAARAKWHNSRRRRPWQVQWGAYISMLMAYHFLEFAVTAVYHPKDVTFECKLRAAAVRCHATIDERAACRACRASVLAVPQHGVCDSDAGSLVRVLARGVAVPAVQGSDGCHGLGAADGGVRSVFSRRSHVDGRPKLQPHHCR